MRLDQNVQLKNYEPQVINKRLDLNKSALSFCAIIIKKRKTRQDIA